MSLVLVSPNMLLPVPIVSEELGPAWATDLNACMSILDQHNHSSGSGVQISPNGLNINSDLTFLSNNAIALRSTRFTSQGSALALVTDIGCLYVVGNELYYNDVTGGHNVQITTNGSVNAGAGSITGLPSGTASASYSAGTFTWQSATSTAANMDGRNFILRNSTASSKGLTLSPPAAMAADYGLVLPALPAQTNVMTLDVSGNISSTTWNSVANNRTRATGSTVGAGGVAVSASSGAFSSSSGSFTPVTNLSVTITTSGRPVWVCLVPDSSGSFSYLTATVSSGAVCTASFEITQNGTAIALAQLSVGGASGNISVNAPVSSLATMDPVAAGTYTYAVAVSMPNGSSIGVRFAKLVAYEL